MDRLSAGRADGNSGLVHDFSGSAGAARVGDARRAMGADENIRSRESALREVGPPMRGGGVLRTDGPW